MKNKENFQIALNGNVIKVFLYFLFLGSVIIYFVFFDRNLKLETSEKCSCNGSEYILYQYIDTGTLLNRSKFSINNSKTFKLENKFGFTVSKIVNIDIKKLDDTITSNLKIQAKRPFGMQFYWDCDNKEVWISGKYKLQF